MSGEPEQLFMLCNPPPSCVSCGVPYANHLGIQGTCAKLKACEDVLRSLASWLGVGGYNADEVDPSVFEAKIRDGVDILLRVERERLERLIHKAMTIVSEPIPMRTPCPECGELHIDKGQFATKSHHTHACQYCGCVWRRALVTTMCVRFLPGFKDEEQEAKS